MVHSMMEIRTQPVGAWAMNTYVLVCPTSRQSVLIDPGAEPAVLLELLDGTIPQAIVITHTHADHIGALAEVRTRLGVPVLAHPGPHVAGVTLRADRWLHQDDLIDVGDHRLKVYETPGHTEDMVCFEIEQESRMFVGDTIFEGGPGRTVTPEHFLITLYTLQTVVLAWSDDMICYPGHGPSFRLGDRRTAIESFLSKDHKNFCGDASWNM